VSWHPSDDELILHFYGESAGMEQPIDAHLASCPSCQDAWTGLTHVLALVDGATVPEPDASFERVMWARVQPSLPSRRSRLSWLKVLVPLAAAAVLIVGAFVAGRTWSSRTSATAMTAASAELATAHERVLLTALNDHFERSEMLLVEVMNAPDAKHMDLTFARATASDLVASSRLYRQTTEQHGDTRLTALLEDLEAVLIEVAHSPAEVSAANLKDLRARITDDSLLFKVRAVANEIEQRQQHMSSVSEGTL
jgi:hypothetical protein